MCEIFQGKTELPATAQLKGIALDSPELLEYLHSWERVGFYPYAFLSTPSSVPVYDSGYYNSETDKILTLQNNDGAEITIFITPKAEIERKESNGMVFQICIASLRKNLETFVSISSS